jgi:hypothetical protein
VPQEAKTPKMKALLIFIFLVSIFHGATVVEAHDTTPVIHEIPVAEGPGGHNESEICPVSLSDRNNLTTGAVRTCHPQNLTTRPIFEYCHRFNSLLSCSDVVRDFCLSSDDSNRGRN